MTLWWTRARTLSLACLMTVVLALTACGGAGGSAKDTGNGAGGGGGGGGGSSTAATLTGVVAAGAPMLGASLSVRDASGAVVGSGSASLADGSYTLTLNTGTPSLPLFIQASGVDMAGQPLLLYTVVPALADGSTARTVVHLNNLTTALCALLLGDEPRKHFSNAASRHGEWTVLASAAAQTAAQTWLKNVVKANLTDGKLTDLTRVDFMSDPDFSPNKTGLDVALESVRVRFTTNVAGRAIMQISNRLILPGASEVSVDLAQARSGLAASTPAIASGATLSTLTATTGNSAFMPFLAGLDTLGATLNAAIASQSDQATILGLGMFNSAFTFHDNQTPADFAATLQGWAGLGQQLSRFQLKGCLDTTLSSKGCTQMAASALVRDNLGQVAGIFDMVVTYATASGWTLLGNSRRTPWAIYPVTWAQWTAEGLLDSSAAHNPGQGVQVVIGSSAFVRATLQLPNGFALPFYYCDIATLCLTGSGSTGVFTGDLITDQVVRSTMVGWVGSSDAAPGARYGIQTLTLVAGSENNSTVLTTDMPGTSDRAAYPLPDGLSVATPLRIADFTAGLPVSWATWAAANPDKRVIEVRAVITSTASLPEVLSVTVLPLSGHSLTLPAFANVPTDALGYTLWLIAQDDQGRRYISKIAAL